MGELKKLLNCIVSLEYQRQDQGLPSGIQKGRLHFRSQNITCDTAGQDKKNRLKARFRNLNSTVPVDVVKVKSYVNSFSLPYESSLVRLWVNKRNFVSMWVLPGLFVNG